MNLGGAFEQKFLNSLFAEANLFEPIDDDLLENWFLCRTALAVDFVVTVIAEDADPQGVVPVVRADAVSSLYVSRRQPSAIACAVAFFTSLRHVDFEKEPGQDRSAEVPELTFLADAVHRLAVLQSSRLRRLFECGSGYVHNSLEKVANRYGCLLSGDERTTFGLELILG